jgi:hypothetical protein
MKAPAAMARIARTVPRPAKAWTKGNKPVRISQMPNSRKPIFLVIFNLLSL